jgi:aminoglycoside 6'-N-acetyltransferase I
MVLTITDLADQPDAIREQVAQFLVDAFQEMAPTAWPTLAAAREEVSEALEADRICRVALLDGRAAGWIGAQLMYTPHVWELHPLVVDPAQQGKGIGRALVLDLEQRVIRRGGATIMLGTDDEAGWTSLAGVDLYPDPLRHLAQIRNLSRHPFEFYQKLGYVLIGVVPDANGPGKPDLLMAKKVKIHK